MHNEQITTVDKLSQEKLVGAQVDGVELVAAAAEDGIHVFAGRCPHQGTLLSEGSLEDGTLTCRGHGWQFDPVSGAKVDDPQTCLHQFSAVVDGDKVLVDRAEIAAWSAEREALQEVRRDRRLLKPEDLPGPPSLPFVGNMHQIKVDRFHLILEDWYRQYGDLYQFKLGLERALVVADPELMQKILKARPEKFSRLGDIRKTIEEMGIEGLFSVEGEQWRRHRQLATHAFDVRHLRQFFPLIAKVTRRLQRRWQLLAQQGTPFDVQQEFMRYTVDITTNLAFGYDMNTLAEEGDRIQQEIEVVFPKIAYRAFIPVRYWNYLKLPSDRALESSLEKLRAAINQFIDHARQQLAEKPALRERPENLLQALLVARADENIEFSDLEIYGNVMTFLLAGEDTTANSMAWMMYFMTRHPDVQRQMQAEADAVLGDAQTVVEYQEVQKLRYIEAVAHETLRFKPVGPFLALQALKDVTVDSLSIPRGTPVFALLRPKGLENSEFAAAGAFKPERWLSFSHQDNPHHRKSYMPFGGGPRLCPGRSLALLEMRMAMSMICHHFDVVPAEGQQEQDIAERFVFTMMPQDLQLALRPRVM